MKGVVAVQAAADHGGLPVVVHGFAPTTAHDLAVLAGLARRYPSVPLVISQLGGLNWLTAVELVRDRETKKPAADVLDRVQNEAKRRGLIIGRGGLHARRDPSLPAADRQRA